MWPAGKAATKAKGPHCGGLSHEARPSQTASFAALTGLARTILRAGLALNIISSPVKGLVPLRALVAGFLTTTNLAKPGTRNSPFFLSSLWPTSTKVSMTFLTSRLDSSVDVAIRSMSCDLESWVAIVSPFDSDPRDNKRDCENGSAFRTFFSEKSLFFHAS